MLGGLVRACLLFAAVSMLAQEPAKAPGAKCVLEGTAVDFATGEPVRKASIRLAPGKGNGPGQLAVTDASGYFHFEQVPPGEYELTGEATGYLKSEFGARKAGGSGSSLQLKAGDKLSGLILKLARCSIVSGRVLDENGDPIANTSVFAVQRDWLRGQPMYSRSRGALTNDAGEYRIIDLPAGHYYLCADASSEGFVEKQGGQEKRLVWSFYPGSRSLDGAQIFDLQSGQEVRGIDFQLRPEPVFHIRGKMAGKVVGDNDTVLMSVHPHNLGNGVVGELDNGMKLNGTFDFAGAPAGNYDLELVGDERKQTIANLSIEVKKADVNGIVIAVPNRLMVKGVVRRPDGDATASRVTVFARDLGSPAMSIPYAVAPALDGTFEMDGLWPGKYVFGVDRTATGEYLKSVQYRGQELSERGVELTGGAGQVEITLASGAARIDASIQADAGVFVGGLEVVLAPRSEGSVLLGKTDQSGHANFENVAPGTYDVFALADVDSELLENRDLVLQLQGDGMEVEVPENGNLQIRIPLLPAEDVQRALSALGL